MADGKSMAHQTKPSSSPNNCPAMRGSEDRFTISFGSSDTDERAAGLEDMVAGISEEKWRWDTMAVESKERLTTRRVTKCNIAANSARQIEIRRLGP